MRLRNLHFPAKTATSLCEVLKLSGFPATVTGDEAMVTNWLEASSFLKAASDALSKLPTDNFTTLPPGHLWTLLSEEYWEDFCRIIDNFTWEKQEEVEIRSTETFARLLLQNRESIGETIGDPILFIAALRWDYGEHGRMAAALASAVSVLSVVWNYGGDFIWNRFVFDCNSPARKLNVSWDNGIYVLGKGWLQRKKASRRASSHLGQARLLRSLLNQDKDDREDGLQEQSFHETKNVAVAAMWLGVPVRTVRLQVLQSLLLSAETSLVHYAEIEGVDLGDLLAVGGETALHSSHGKVILLKGRTLVYPSLHSASAGYSFRCQWGLTRAEILSSGRKECYDYLRVQNKDFGRDWSISRCETYVCRGTLTDRLISLGQYAFFAARMHMPRGKHAKVNTEDAKARLRRKGEYVETTETTTAKPAVNNIMLKALSDRIPVNLNRSEADSSWEKCFGENERPAGNSIQDDEQVLVLSYRHESIHVRMGLSNWRCCYEDLAEVAAVHGKKAMRVWTDKLASNTRGEALWIESGVDPYRNAVVVAFNGPRDSIFVDRFWLSLERNTAFRAWGYWLRDDIGQLVRFGKNPYPARTEDRDFLSQILFTPGRADGPLWEEDRLTVLREAAEQLGVVDMDSLWDALTWEFLPSRYAPFDVVNQERQSGLRRMRGVGWSAAADVLVDRELLERAVGFAFEARTNFEVRKWVSELVDGGNRFVSVKSKVSDDWFCAVVRVEEDEGGLRVTDVFDRQVIQTKRLEEYTADLEDCSGESWM